METDSGLDALTGLEWLAKRLACSWQRRMRAKRLHLILDNVSRPLHSDHVATLPQRNRASQYAGRTEETGQAITAPFYHRAAAALSPGWRSRVDLRAEHRIDRS